MNSSNTIGKLNDGNKSCSSLGNESVELGQDLEDLRLYNSALQRDFELFDTVHSSSFEEGGNCIDTSVHPALSFDVSAIEISNCKLDDGEDRELSDEISLNSTYTEKTFDKRRISLMLAALHDSEDKTNSLSDTSVECQTNAAAATADQDCLQAQQRVNSSKDTQCVKKVAKESYKKDCLLLPDTSEKGASSEIKDTATSPLYTIACADVHTPDSYENFIPTSKFEYSENKIPHECL